ncbi:hypothetical protein Tco_0817864 [Tanacetum coccineum]
MRKRMVLKTGAELNKRRVEGYLWSRGQNRPLGPLVIETNNTKNKFFKSKFNTAEVKAVSVVGGKGKLLSPQQVVIGEPKDITGINSPNTMVDQILENVNHQSSFKEIKDCLIVMCSRHMKWKQGSLLEDQDYNGGLVAFGANYSISISFFCVTECDDKKNRKSELESINLLKTTLYCQYGLLILQQSRAQKQRIKANDAAKALRKEFAQDTKDLLLQAGAARASSTNTVNTASTPVSTASPSGGLSYTDLTNTDQNDSQIPALEDIYNNPNDGIFTNASYDDEGTVADFTNLESIVNVSPIPTSRIHSIHPSTQILGNPKSAVQTRSKVNKSSGYIQKQRRNNHKDYQHCLFACFLSQIEPKKISEALGDEIGLMLCRKNCCNSRFRKFGFL